MPRASTTLGLLGLITVVLGFIAKAFYRSWINAEGINDFGIQGFLPSFFYVIGFSLLLLMRLTSHPYITIATVTFASIIFEIKQFFFSGIIDNEDIFASMAGGMLASIIFRIIK